MERGMKDESQRSEANVKRSKNVASTSDVVGQPRYFIHFLFSFAEIDHETVVRRGEIRTWLGKQG